MTIFQNFTLAFLTTMVMAGQLSATSLDVEVDGTDTGTISAGITTETLFKKGSGLLDLTGPDYNIDYITVQDGHVYVHGAPGLYLRQPVTLGLGRYITHYTQINLEVDTGDSSRVTAPIIAAEVTKKGGGTLDFDCVGSIIDYLRIQGGRVIVDASDIIPAIGLYFDGANCILEATTDINLPEVTLSFDGAINSTKAVTMDSLILGGKVLTTDIVGDTIVNNLDTSASGGTIANADTLTLNGATGSNLLIKSGSGYILVVVDLHSASLPIDVVEGTMRVSGVGKLPTAAMTIGATGSVGAIFELCSNTVAGAVPGLMEVQQYGVLSVDDNISVPAAHTAGDVFTGGLLFDSGSVLKLGAGSSWARDIVVGTAL
ncbi:MAG: hypothetical protein WCJ92_00940 [Alphaproteobacteria bacterium]